MSANTFTPHTGKQEQFSQQLLKVLRAHPVGISEYELIQQLAGLGNPQFEPLCLRGNLSLFQTHFFLFHSLYRLRDTLSNNNEARLDISALCIQLIPLPANTGNEIAAYDPLRDYYLDLNNLENTKENEVDALISTFWYRFVRDDDRYAALAELELEDPVDWITIKSQHRRLAMKHHPDRGGNEHRLQAINAAMNVLTRAEPRPKKPKPNP